VSRDKAQVLMGFGLTPLALAAAPIATQAKVPMIVTAAATSIIPQRSPYIVRTGFTLAQVTSPLASWAAKNGIKSVVTFVSDYGPGLDAEKVFVKTFSEAGGKVMESVRVPLRNPDYALPAAGEGRQAGLVRFCSFRGRCCRAEAVYRAGIGSGRDSPDLYRRCAR
jgi:branched-chain amino acid transport system substrate-binding protein